MGGLAAAGTNQEAPSPIPRVIAHEASRRVFFPTPMGMIPGSFRVAPGAELGRQCHWKSGH